MRRIVSVIYLISAAEPLIITRRPLGYRAQDVLILLGGRYREPPADGAGGFRPNEKNSRRIIDEGTLQIFQRFTVLPLIFGMPNSIERGIDRCVALFV